MRNDEVATLEPAHRAEIAGQRLALISNPASRSPRTVTNLAKVFGQFADVQQQVAEQVLILEETLSQQRQETAVAAAQLPELKERINWLIAGFYEQSQHNAVIEERCNQQRDDLAKVTATVQTLCETQHHWLGAIDQLIDVLVRARGQAQPPNLVAITAAESK